MPHTDIQSSKSYVLFCQGRLADPFPLYHRLRSEDPVHWCPLLNSWILTRYDHVLAAHLDLRLSSNKPRVKMEQLPSPLRSKVKALGEHLSLWVSHTDPPVHTQLRKVVNQAFSPRIIEALRPRLQKEIDALIDEVQPQGQMDLIRDFAYPLPVTIVSELLGIPPDDRERFRNWIEDIVAFIDGSALTLSKVAEQSLASLIQLTTYFHEVVDQRWAQPQDDLISCLVGLEKHDKALNSEELLAMCVQMLVGGHDTTTALIGNAMLSLLQHPSERERLQDNPQHIKTAVEEFLRFDSPGPRNTRLVLEDLEIGGKHIRQGQAAVLMLAAANRDPQQFPDPDRLDICRHPNKHLSFGWGLHFCLGAPLARLEAQLAVNTLLRRLPHLRLSDDGTRNPPWLESMGLRILKSLDVLF